MAETNLPDTIREIVNRPDTLVVAKLEEWLEAAKRGEIDGVALAAETTTGASRYAYAGRYGSRLVGGLAFPQHQFMHKMADDGELDK